MLVTNTGFRLKSAAGLGVSLVLGRLFQAAAFFVMARVLVAEEMAVVALLTLIYTGLFQLTNLGFERYIVYSKDNTEDEFNTSVDTVWTMQLIRGALVVAATLLFGYFLVSSNKFDIGFDYLGMVALAVVVLSLVNPGLSGYERAGDFSFAARSQGYAAVAGAAVSITVVIIWETPWAYVIGQLVNAALIVALSFLYVPRRPQLSWSLENLKTVFAYSKHMLVIAVVSFLSSHAQNFYVAAAFSPVVLGMYFTWYRFVNLPRELITQLSMRILFAKASDEARQGESIAASHIRGFSFTVITLLPFCLLVWFHGDYLITLLAGEKWTSYWWAGRLMVLANLCLALANTVGPFMLVQLPHVSSTLRTAEAAATIALIFALGPTYGDTGVLVAVLSVMTVALLLRIAILYARLLKEGRMAHARAALFVIGVVCLPLLFVEAALTLAPAGATWPPLLAIGTYGAYSCGLLLIALKRKGVLLKGTI